MRKLDAISYFGTQKALAAAIGYAESTVSEWGEIVPLAPAVLIERATRGRRKVNYSLYERTARIARRA
jgi:DNA-binding transcriptional regulator YdaS (Cro superfamily)